MSKALIVDDLVHPERAILIGVPWSKKTVRKARHAEPSKTSVVL